MSRRSERACIRAVVSLALGGFALVAGDATAQTWNNSNSGPWSLPTNWVGGAVPISSNTTQLSFNAAGSTSYLSTNDLANPFMLNALNFNHSGSGTIFLDGNPLLFAGTNPAINQLGTGGIYSNNPIQITSTGANTDAVTIAGTATGAVTLAGALSSTVVPTGTGGAAVNLIASDTTLHLAGGGTLFSIRSSAGTVVLDGGVWNLASVQRRNDPLTSVDDGPWALSVGETGSQPTQFIMNGGTLTAPNALFAVGNHSTSIATFTNGAIATIDPVNSNLGRFGVGSAAGTINILDGSRVTCRLFDVGRSPRYFGATTDALVVVDGPGTRVDCSQQVVVAREDTRGALHITNGGVVSVTGIALIAGSFIGEFPDGQDGTTLVSGSGSKLETTGNIQVGTTGNGTLLVSNGGQVTSGHLFAGFGGGGLDPGVGTVLIAGGTYRTSQQLLIGSASSVSWLRIADAGVFEMNGAGPGTFVNAFTANRREFDLPDRAVIEVNGAGSRFVQSGASTFMSVSGSTNGTEGGITTITISNGGLMQIGRGTLLLASDANGVAVALVSGPGSALRVGTGGMGDLLAASEAGASATLNVQAGAVADVAANSYASPVPGATSLISIEGGTWTSGGQLQLGGAGGVGGGTSTVGITNGGFVSSGGASAVYSHATLSVGIGASRGTYVSGGDLAVDGHVFYNSGTMQTAGQLSVGGTVVLSDAQRDAGGTPLNKEVVEAGSLAFTSSGFIDLNDNDAIVHNNSLAEVENFVRTGRNGGSWNGTMLVSTAAKNHPLRTTGLGVISGAQFHSAQGDSALFNDRTVANSDVLIKYTYNGDTDFNGKIDGADFARIDTAFNNQASQSDVGGWFNGDFDYNGRVDGADYALMDAAFNSQGIIVLSRATDPAGPDAGRTFISAIAGIAGWATVHIADLAVAEPVGPIDGEFAPARIPEPASVTCAAMLFAAALTTRRRRRV